LHVVDKAWLNKSRKNKNSKKCITDLCSIVTRKYAFCPDTVSEKKKCTAGLADEVLFHCRPSVAGKDPFWAVYLYLEGGWSYFERATCRLAKKKLKLNNW
jgi:hypothetical protein